MRFGSIARCKRKAALLTLTITSATSDATGTGLFDSADSAAVIASSELAQSLCAVGKSTCEIADRLLEPIRAEAERRAAFHEFLRGLPVKSVGQRARRHVVLSSRWRWPLVRAPTK